MTAFRLHFVEEINKPVYRGYIIRRYEVARHPVEIEKWHNPHTHQSFNVIRATDPQISSRLPGGKKYWAIAELVEDIRRLKVGEPISPTSSRMETVTLSKAEKRRLRRANRRALQRASATIR